mgnify:CR=1 FL=1
MKRLKALIVEDNAFVATVLEDVLQQFSKTVSLVQRVLEEQRCN